MVDAFMPTFEKHWVDFRSQWCQRHDLGGAVALSHEGVKIDFFHRVVQVNVEAARVEGLVDEAVRLFQDKGYDCAFTLSPLDRPEDLGARLEGRGFARGVVASAMEYRGGGTPLQVTGVAQVEASDESEYDLWAEVMCRSFGHPAAMGQAGRAALLGPDVRRYLARVDGAPAGTALLCSRLGMGYIDLVGTLPEQRRQGVASALVAKAVADSEALGNRWTSLETAAGSDAERLYGKLGFERAYHRCRYVRALNE